MMMRIRSGKGWTFAVAGLGPILTIAAAKFVVNAGPPSASASIGGDEPEPEPATATGPAGITPEQRRALDWLDSPGFEAALSRSPMHRPDPPVLEVVESTVVDKPHAPSEGRRAVMPPLRLGGIVTRGESAIASINHRLYLVGDMPAEGWTIGQIDASARRVILHGRDGRRAELTAQGIEWLDPGEPRGTPPPSK